MTNNHPTPQPHPDREALIAMLEQAMLSPASGSVVWTEEAIARMKSQVAYLADSILAKIGSPSVPEGEWTVDKLKALVKSPAVTNPLARDIAEAVIGDWCEKGDKRDNRDLIYQGAALALSLSSAPEPPVGDGWTQAALDVLSERKRQIEVEGWTPEHDDEHAAGELALAASCYASIAGRPEDVRVNFPAGRPQGRWPWDPSWFKPKGPREDLIRAGALILAEIERLDRLPPSSAEGK